MVEDSYWWLSGGMQPDRVLCWMSLGCTGTAHSSTLDLTHCLLHVSLSLKSAVDRATSISATPMSHSGLAVPSPAAPWPAYAPTTLCNTNVRQEAAARQCWCLCLGSIAPFRYRHVMFLVIRPRFATRQFSAQHHYQGRGEFCTQRK